MVSKPAVGNSSAFLTNLPFHDFSQKGEPRLVVEIIGKNREKAGLSKMRMSCRRLLQTKILEGEQK
jgi:hypothetical protein